MSLCHCIKLLTAIFNAHTAIRWQTTPYTVCAVCVFVWGTNFYDATVLVHSTKAGKLMKCVKIMNLGPLLTLLLAQFLVCTTSKGKCVLSFGVDRLLYSGVSYHTECTCMGKFGERIVVNNVRC